MIPETFSVELVRPFISLKSFHFFFFPFNCLFIFVLFLYCFKSGSLVNDFNTFSLHPREPLGVLMFHKLNN